MKRVTDRGHEEPVDKVDLNVAPVFLGRLFVVLHSQGAVCHETSLHARHAGVNAGAPEIARTPNTVGKRTVLFVVAQSFPLKSFVTCIELHIHQCPRGDAGLGPRAYHAVQAQLFEFNDDITTHG